METTLKPRPYQKAALVALDTHLREKAGNPCVVLPTGCHAKGQGVMLENGDIVSVEDVLPGDFLMGPDSTPRRVLQLCRGRGEMFTIEPVKGEPFTVNGDHILTLERVRESSNPKYPCQRRSGEWVDVSVREWMGWSKWKKHVHKLVRSPVSSFGYDWVDGRQPIPPYIMGLLLGDGSFDAQVGLTTADPEVRDEWLAYLSSIGCSYSVHASKRKTCPTYRARNAGRSQKGGGIMQGKVRDVGLWKVLSGDKFIPNIYLKGSVAGRRELLAGLIDSDGSLSRSGYDYISKSEPLARGVAFVARSLGLAAYVKPCRKKCQGGFVGDYFRVSISGECSAIPCRLPRKKAPARRQKKSVLKTGFTVSPAGDGDYYGFALDGDRRYLMDDFTVTHNSGKSPVMAWLVQGYKQMYPSFRCIVLAHVKELVAQNADKLKQVWPDAPIGIHSAGLRRRDMHHDIMFASIDSVYKKGLKFDPFDLILVDEAHRIPMKGEGKYRSFIADCKLSNPKVRVVGMTATPYRMGIGDVCHQDHILNEICYEANVADLIRDGYLCPLRSKAGSARADLDGVKKRGGEYITSSLAEATDRPELVAAAIREAMPRLEGRAGIIFFCVDVNHCEHVSQELKKYGVDAPCVTGSTPQGERDRITKQFTDGQIRAICNVNVLTEGFDATRTDAIVLLRPTKSKGLFYQMVGRGLRLDDRKEDCLVLDFAGCVEEHGPIDQLDGDGVRVETCPECAEMFSRAVGECPECGWKIPKKIVERDDDAEPGEKRMHSTSASDHSILSDSGPQTLQVSSVSVNRHRKPGKPDSLRVSYRCGLKTYREWVCLNHDGVAGSKARQWWRRRFGDPVIGSVDEALVDLFLAARLSQMTEAITVVPDGKYFRITDVKLRPAQTPTERTQPV